MKSGRFTDMRELLLRIICCGTVFGVGNWAASRFGQDFATMWGGATLSLFFLWCVCYRIRRGHWYGAEYG